MLPSITTIAYLRVSTINRREVKSYLRGQLAPSRIEEIDKEILKLGIAV